MSENPNEDPKIIVDDDWKEQVQREKEELQKETEAPQSEPDIPPASFAMLVSSLSTQALAALGYIPDPVSGQPMVNRDLAKHLIDILGILEEKTQGNLDENESALITETVHQLRMAFVSSGHQSEPDADENKGPTIELP